MLKINRINTENAKTFKMWFSAMDCFCRGVKFYAPTET